MGTHPIFESDFDCLTEISDSFQMGNCLRAQDSDDESLLGDSDGEVVEPNKKKKKKKKKNAKRPFNFPLFWDFLSHLFYAPFLDLFFVLKGQHNYLVKSMSPFFSSLPHFEIAKVVTFFKDMIWVKLVSLQSVFYIFCVFVTVRK